MNLQLLNNNFFFSIETLLKNKHALRDLKIHFNDFLMPIAPTTCAFKIKIKDNYSKPLLRVMTWLKIRIRWFYEHSKRTKKCRTKKGAMLCPMPRSSVFCGRTKKRAVCFPSLVLLDVYRNLFYKITCTPRKYSILKLISKEIIKDRNCEFSIFFVRFVFKIA